VPGSLHWDASCADKLAMTFNGWQRLWIVISALWLLPFAAALLAYGLPTIYKAPAMTEWVLQCDMVEVANQLSKNGESEADIQALIDSERDNKFFGLSFYVPDGKVGSGGDSLNCADAALIYNPKTKRKQLRVHANLDTYGSATLTGYDLDSATKAETEARIARSKIERREVLWGGLGVAFGVPAFLYAFGSAIAWIRRGFRQQEEKGPQK